MKHLGITSLCLLPCLVMAQEKVLSTVQVTAGSDDVAERRQAATQKVIIETKDIENMGALTVSDVMGKLPGVDAGSPGADGSMAMRARGMVRDSVQIMIDGERVPGNARMAQAMVGRLPSNELDRVEIIRGASAEFGGAAPVTVNLVFKKARSKSSTVLKAALGMRNNELNEQFSFSKGDGDAHFSWSLPLTLNHHVMPSERRLERQDSSGTQQVDSSHGSMGIREMVFSPRLVWKDGGDNFNLSPSFFRSYGTTDSLFQRSDSTNAANDLSRSDHDRSRTGFNRIRADGEITRNGRKYSARLTGSQGQRIGDTQRTYSSSVSNEHTERHEHDLTMAVRVDRPIDQHLLAVSLEMENHHRRDSLLGGITSETHEGWQRNYLLWAQDEWSPRQDLTYTYGMRVEFLRYASDSNEQHNQRWMPSVAVRWEPAKQWVLRSSLGSSIKAPRLDELVNQPVYSVNVNSPLEADRRGNPNLRPEKAINFEAVLERYLPEDMGVAGVNVYLRHTNDFTERRTTLEGTRWVDRPYNEGFARLWGVELDGKLRTDHLGWRGATLRAHLTVPRSRVDDTRLGISRTAREAPKFQVSAGIDQTLNGDWSLGSSVQYFSQVNTEIPGEQRYETQNRTVADAYAVRKLMPGVNLRFTVQNLLKADTRKMQTAWSGNSEWRLNSRDTGTRAIMMTLEGKW